MSKAQKWPAIVFCLLSFVILLRVLFLDFYPDFSVYYLSSKLSFEGQNPYLAKNLFAPFNYPPFVLLFFFPFTKLPYQLSQNIWLITSIILLLLSLYLLSFIYKENIFSPKFLILSSFVFISFPTKFTLGMGQINIFILLLVILFLYFSLKKREYLSGVFLGVSIILKLFPILLIPYLIMIKKWKIIFSTFITIILLTLLTLIIIPPDTNQYFLNHVLPTLFSPWSGVYYNQSLSGFLARILPSGQFIEHLKFLFSVLLLIISFIVVTRREKRDWHIILLEIGSLITLSLLINNFSWQHHFIWLIIPFFGTYYYLVRKKSDWKLWGILLLIYIFVSINFKQPENINNLLQSHVFFGSALLYFLQIYLLLKY